MLDELYHHSKEVFPLSVFYFISIKLIRQGLSFLIKSIFCIFSTLTFSFSQSGTPEEESL